MAMPTGTNLLNTGINNWSATLSGGHTDFTFTDVSGWYRVTHNHNVIADATITYTQSIPVTAGTKYEFYIEVDSGWSKSISITPNGGTGYSIVGASGATEISGTWVAPAGTTSITLRVLTKAGGTWYTSSFKNPYMGIAAPVVDAGPSKAVTMPNAVTMEGSVVDSSPSSGTPVIAWSKYSGPGTVTFSNAASLTPSVTFSVEGNYTLRIAATEHGLTSYDYVSVTVSPPPPPTVDAGTNQFTSSILPAGATLTGTVTDNNPATPAPTVLWTVDDPSVTIASPTSLTTSVTIPNEGSYTFTLTATDGAQSASDTVVVSVVDASTPSGGPEYVYGTNLITQHSASVGVSNWKWRDNPPHITTGTEYAATVSGEYITGSSQTGDWYMTHTPDISITPGQTYNLSFDFTNSLSTAYGWVVLRFKNASGANVGNTFSYTKNVWDGNSDKSVNINFVAHPDAAKIVLAFAVDNGSGSGSFGVKNVSLRTIDLGNQYFVIPTAEFAGANGLALGPGSLFGPWWEVVGQETQDMNIGPDVNSSSRLFPAGYDAFVGATIRPHSGATTVPDKARVTVHWRSENGSSYQAVTGEWMDVSNGYVYARMTPPTGLLYGKPAFSIDIIGSSQEASAEWDITDIIFAAVPVVNAGSDQAITLPSNITLSGSVSPISSETEIQWIVEGPGVVTISNPSSPTTTAYVDSPGTYTFTLTAIQGGVASAEDSITVTVSPENNQPPVVNAGSDMTITLPENASLNGFVSDDVPGTDVLWTMTSGPGTVVFDNAAVPRTTVSFSTDGVYVLTLTADDGEFVVTDSVTILVNPEPNQPPTVEAGENQAVNLPPGVAYLNGIVSEDATSTMWSASGPGTVTFGNENAVVTEAVFDTAGTYTLTLTAFDGEFQASDTMTVFVVVEGQEPVNDPPVVSAGMDKSITINNSAELNGIVADDGPVTILWSATGPGTVTFADATSLVTTATFSVTGAYTITLTADDGEFQVSDSLIVAVQPEPDEDPNPGVNDPPPDLGQSPPAGTDPTGGFIDGDTWFQRDANNIIIGHWEYNGGFWYAKAIGNQVIATLDAGKITTGYLDASRINVHSITSTKLADGAVTGEKIANGVIDATKITPGSITATALADGSVTTTKIVGGSITTSHIAASGIDAGVIKTGTLHGDRITANTISGDKILARSIGADKIVANGITAYELSTYAITTNHLTANNVIAAAVTAADMTAATITGSTIQTGAGTYGTIKMRGRYNDMVMYSPSGQRMFYIDASTGYVEVNGVIKTSPYGQRIEMGNTGPNDPADEIRMFNGGSVISMRNYTDAPGHVYFSIQRNNSRYSSAFTIYPTNDGHLLVGRGSIFGSGAKIKYLESSDGIQVRNGIDTGYAPIRASAFNTSSLAKFKEDVEDVTVYNTAEILKKNGLKKWKWIWNEDIPQRDAKTGKKTAGIEKASEESKQGMGLMADNLPDFLRTTDGYSLTAVVGFLWEALKEANGRIERLEGRENGQE